MALLTNGKVTVEVPDEKAEKYSLILGYRIMDAPKAEDEVEKPVAKRGRPKKASN